MILVETISLFVIVNPVSAVPLFLAMTEEVGRANRSRTALLAALTTAGILGGTALIGQQVLDILGISVDALRIAGGSLLFLYAIDMIQYRQSRMDTTDHEVAEGAAKSEVGVIPLGIPMLAGPGAIATTLVLRAQGEAGLPGLLSLLGAIAIVAASVLVAFRIAIHAERWLNSTTLGIVIRLEALLLAAIGAQMLIGGIAGAFHIAR